LATVTYTCVQGGWPGEGNINVDPRFVDSQGKDFHLQNGSPCIDRGLLSVAPGEDIEGEPRPGNDGRVDIGAYESPSEYEPGPASHIPTLLYVRRDAPEGGDGYSWDTGFNSIQSALDISSTSDEVWVAAGTYYESISMERTVSLYGGFTGTEISLEEREWTANETIIDATGLNTSVVIGANFAILDGFTITGGSPESVSHYSEIDGFGGGVYCNNSSPMLTNCTITNNTSFGGGGGVYCNDSSPTLTNCTITNNKANNYGGGVHCSDSFPTLTNCTITNNTSDYVGGGVYCIESSPTLIKCAITNNTATWIGGGVYCKSFSSPMLTNCTITNNFTWMFGGGISCQNSSSPTLINCTIADNTAYDIIGDFGAGGGIYCSNESSPMLTNCVLWGDSPNEIDVSDSTPEITWSNIEGGWPGEGNIDADPLFIDAGSGDYHLSASSPCIDTGRNKAALSIPSDFDGNIRIWDGDNIPGAIVDMGAYEFDSINPIPWQDISGDADRGGFVSAMELSLAISYFREVLSPPHPSVDVDNDGIVSAFELSHVISAFQGTL